MERELKETAAAEKYYRLDANGHKCYTNGPGKPPIFIQAILDDREMSDNEFFRITNAYLDWDKQGDDAAVLEPLIALLAKWGDKLIFAFEDRMAQLLYSLDTRRIANNVYKGEHFSKDDFLYTRCVVLVNGKQYYNDIIRGVRRLGADLQFDAILYAPVCAWARCHLRAPEAYPHVPPVSYETMSNQEAWQEVTPATLASFISANVEEPLEVRQVFCECGCRDFRVRLDAGCGAMQLTCLKCGTEKLQFTSAELWQTCRPRRRKCGNCRSEVLNVSVGLVKQPDGRLQRVYLGARCVKCDELFMLANWPLD